MNTWPSILRLAKSDVADWICDRTGGNEGVVGIQIGDDLKAASVQRNNLALDLLLQNPVIAP